MGCGGCAFGTVCPAGRYALQYSTLDAPNSSIKTGVRCRRAVETKDQCVEAARSLGLAAVRVGGNKVAINPDGPMGCYVSAKWGNLHFGGTSSKASKACTTDLDCARLICFDTACSDCPSGTYASISGVRESCEGTACAAGRFGPRGAESSLVATCTSCPLGQYSAEEGASNCGFTAAAIGGIAFAGVLLITLCCFGARRRAHHWLWNQLAVRYPVATQTLQSCFRRCCARCTVFCEPPIGAVAPVKGVGAPATTQERHAWVDLAVAPKERRKTPPLPGSVAAARGARDLMQLTTLKRDDMGTGKGLH